MLRLSRFATLVCSASMLAAAGRSVDSNAAALAQARSAMAQLPLRFEANLGQMNSEVRYAARSGGVTLVLTSQGPSFRLPGARRVDVSLLKSNRAPEIEALDRSAARIDSYVGGRDRWRTHIPSYARVRYRSVYPGVDVEYYGNQGQLEYDFVVAPGADPRGIRMQFTGEARLRLTPEGDLVLESGGQRLVQKRPVVYQVDPRTSARVEVAGGYRLLGHNQVGLRLGRYDRRRTLVVDPVLSYLTYWGGPGADQINAAKMDSKGRLYITGPDRHGPDPVCRRRLQQRQRRAGRHLSLGHRYHRGWLQPGLFDLPGRHGQRHPAGDRRGLRGGRLPDGLHDLRRFSVGRRHRRPPPRPVS